MLYGVVFGDCSLELVEKQNLAVGGNVAGASGTFEYGLLPDELTDGNVVFDCLFGVHLFAGKRKWWQDKRARGVKR